MIVKYVNSKGVEVNLNKEPYKMLVSDLLDYEWEVITSANRITGFGYTVKEKVLNIDVHRNRDAGARENMNRLTEIFETDILSGAPGRLYIDEQYMICYIKSSEKDNWETDRIIQGEYGIVTDNPFWITEKHFSFQKKTSKEKIFEYLDHPYDFEYDLLAEPYGMDKIEGGTSSDSHFKMIIYGPAVFPEVFIGGHKYRVNTVVAEGEYLTIDSREQTVVRCMIDGTKINEFDNREHEGHSVFKKIPAGNVEVEWNGSFGWDIMLFEERSEPRW